MQADTELLPADESAAVAAGTRRYQRLEEFRPAQRGRSRWVALAWQLVQATLFAVSPHPMNGWRRVLLRAFGARIGAGVVIRPSARVHFPWHLTIGDRSWVGDEVRLYTLGLIRIGSDTVISQRSHLCAGTHDHLAPSFSTLLPPIAIGDQVWIGAEVFVAPGVTIGDGAVVGARSAVFKNLDGGMVHRGSPARPVEPRVMRPDGTARS
ncbi:MAG TPA: WcaF family extracellular polysaccharide biosynthesis acetyltransferase [Azospirillaceae bacterium]|nr:WcaF family extracellular polysaccharide biosynthesis acetyltransferase [Azospirillaceae bacterium]